MSHPWQNGFLHTFFVLFLLESFMHFFNLHSSAGSVVVVVVVVAGVGDGVGGGVGNGVRTG